MNLLWAIIKGFFKLLFVLCAIALAFGAIFLSIMYFSPPEQYTQVVEKGFSQVTGQSLTIKGGVEFKPSKNFNTTFKDSTITIGTKMGNLQIRATKFYMGLPWNAMFTQNVKFDPVLADNVNLSLLRNNHPVRNFTIEHFSAKIEKTCCELVISNINLVSKEGDANGTLTVLLSEPKLKVSGKLAAKKWVLDKAIDPQTKIYAFQGVNDLEGQIEVDIETLVFPGGEMKNVKAILDLTINILKVTKRD